MSAPATTAPATTAPEMTGPATTVPRAAQSIPRPRRATAAALAALVALAHPALAGEPATDDGAAGIVAAIEPYVGRVPGVVSAVAQGETYRLTLDAGPLAERLAAFLRAAGDSPVSGVPVIAVSPIVLTLTDNGDGTWGVRQDDRFTLRASVPGLLETETASHLRLDGVFDPRLMAFARSETTETGRRTRETQFGPDGTALGEGETTTASMRATTTAAANPAGGVDSTMQGEGRTVLTRQKIFYSPPDDTGRRDTFGIEASVGSYAIDAMGEGMRLVELAALWAWLADQSGATGEIPARQDELKSRLRAALPLFDDLRMTSTAEELRVVTAVLRGGFQRVESALDLTGALREGRVRMALDLSGPDLPVMMLDPWMRPLVPQSAAVDVTLRGFDLAAAAEMTLSALDLTADAPLGTLDGAALQRAVLPGGTLRVDLAPGLVQGADYALAYSGWIEAGPDAPPKGLLRVEAVGLDAVERQIGAGFGQRAEDALAWLRTLRASADRQEGRDIWNLDVAELPGMLPQAEQ